MRRNRHREARPAQQQAPPTPAPRHRPPIAQKTRHFNRSRFVSNTSPTGATHAAPGPTCNCHQLRAHAATHGARHPDLSPPVSAPRCRGLWCLSTLMVNSRLCRLARLWLWRGDFATLSRELAVLPTTRMPPLLKWMQPATIRELPSVRRLGLHCSRRDGRLGGLVCRPCGRQQLIRQRGSRPDEHRRRCHWISFCRFIGLSAWGVQKRPYAEQSAFTM